MAHLNIMIGSIERQNAINPHLIIPSLTPDNYKELERIFYKSIWCQTTTDSNARHYCKHLWSIILNVYNARAYNNLDRISDVLSLTNQLNLEVSSPSMLTLFLENVGTTNYIDMREASANYATMALGKCGLNNMKINIITDLIESSSLIVPDFITNYEYKLTYDLRNLHFALPWVKLVENHALSLKEFEGEGVDNILQGQKKVIQHKIQLIERHKKFFCLGFFEQKYREQAEENLKKFLVFIIDLINTNNGTSFAYYGDEDYSS